MIAPAAPQHSARLDGLISALSRTLPQAAVQVTAPVRGRSGGERRFDMSTTLSVAIRAFAALRATLAGLGLAVLAAFFVFPAQRDALLKHLPTFPNFSL